MDRDQVQEQVRKVIARARVRLGAQAALRVAARGLIVVGALGCLAVLAQRLLWLGTPAAYGVFIGTGAVAGVALALTLRRWPNAYRAAVEVDDRLGLAERVSTALAVAGSDDPMAKAVVEDARSFARSVPVAERFPVRPSRDFLWSIGLGCLAAGLWWGLPQYDLLARKQKEEEARKEAEVVRREARQMRREVQQLRKRAELQGLERPKAQLDKIEQVIDQMEAGRLDRAEAMAQLGELADAFKDAQKSMDRSALKPPTAAERQGLELTRELSKALAAKDLARAQAELKNLADKALSGDFSPQDREKLAAELDKLAKALSENKELGEALKNCSSCLSQGQGASEKDLADAFRLSELELDKLAQIETELALLKKCEGACRGGQKGLAVTPGKGEGEGQDGIYTDLVQGRQGSGQGNTPGSSAGGEAGGGMGNTPASGAGGKAPIALEDTAVQPTRLPGQVQPGRVVGTYFTDGRHVKGEARVEYTREVEAAQTDAAQALDRERIPRRYEEYVRDYFDAMRRQE